MTIGEAQKMLAAIHKHCLECSGGDRKAVDACHMKSCALFPYRQPDRPSGPQKGQEQLSMFEAIKP